MQNREVTGTMKGEASKNPHTGVSPAPEICCPGTRRLRLRSWPDLFDEPDGFGAIAAPCANVVAL